MKQSFLLLLLFFCLVLPVDGQNLVPNGSFEEFVDCPDNSSQIDRALGWVTAGASPDYFNSCAPGFISVPENFKGYQPAANGSAYCGIRVYARGDESNYSIYREVIGSQLSSSLVIGQEYFVSFKASFTLNDSESGIAINKLGALFTTFPITYSSLDSTTAMPTDSNFSHVYTDLIISDTLNWTTISGSFVADSAYSHIYLGNLFENQNTDTIIFNPDPLDGCCSYYYIDDVRVSTDSNFVNSVMFETSLIDAFNIYPNPVQDHFQVRNKFSTPYDITIYDCLAQNIYQETNIIAQSKTFDASAFLSGFLLIRIRSGEHQINYKLIKQ